MTLKRTVTLDASSSVTQVAKRLKRVERKQSMLGPSKFLRDVATTDAGALNDGALRAVQLSNAIQDVKIARIIIKGYLGGANVDCYLVQSPTATAPVYSDFTPTIGGNLTVASAPDEKGFAIWKHYLSLNGGANFSITQKFKFGFISHYEGNAMASTGKQLWLVFKNDSGAAVSPQATAEIFYTPLQ